MHKKYTNKSVCYFSGAMKEWPEKVREAVRIVFWGTKTLQEAKNRLEDINTSYGGEIPATTFGLCPFKTEKNNHHIVAKSRGGRDKWYNIVTLPVIAHDMLHRIIGGEEGVVLLPKEQKLLIDFFEEKKGEPMSVANLKDKRRNLKKDTEDNKKAS